MSISPSRLGVSGALLLICALFSGVAQAGSGAPAFLVLSFPLFTFGLLWTIGAEGLVYRRFSGLSLKGALWEAAAVNIASGMVIGIAFPFAVAFVTGAGLLLPAPLRAVVMTAGTWAFPESPHREIAIWLALPWFVLAFFLTVRFERWFLRRRLAQHPAAVSFEVNKACWIANLISQSGLAIAALLLWANYSAR